MKCKREGFKKKKYVLPFFSRYFFNVMEQKHLFFNFLTNQKEMICYATGLPSLMEKLKLIET